MKKSSLSKVVEKPKVGRGHPRTGRMAPEMGEPIQNAPPSKKKGKTKMSNGGEMNQRSYGGPSSSIIMMGPGGSVGGMMGGPLPRIMGPGGSVGGMMGGPLPRIMGPGGSVGSLMGGPLPWIMGPGGSVGSMIGGPLPRIMGPGGSVGGMMGGPLPRIMGPGGSVGSMMGGTWPRMTGPGESMGSMMGGPRPRMTSPEGMEGRQLDQVFAKPHNPQLFKSTESTGAIPLTFNNSIAEVLPAASKAKNAKSREPSPKPEITITAKSSNKTIPHNPDNNPGTSQSGSVPRGPLPESKENVEALKPKVTTSKIKSGSIKTELWRPYSPSPSIKAKREPLKELAVPRNLERIGGSKPEQSISNQKIPILENVEAPKVPTIWDFKIKIGGMNESSSSPEEDKSIKRPLEKIGELVDSLSNQKIPMFENVKAPKVPTLEIEIGGRNESSSSPGEDKSIKRNLEKIGSAEPVDLSNQKIPMLENVKAPKVPTLEIEIGGRNESSSSPGEDKNILRNLEKIGSAESEDSKNNQKDPEFKAPKLTIKSEGWYVKAESKIKDRHSNKTPTSLPSQKPRRRKHEARKKLTRTELLIKDLQEEILPLRAKKVPPPATSNASKK